MANIGLNKRSFSYMRQIAVRNVKLDPVNPLSYLVEWIAPCSVFLVHWAFALTLSRSFRLSLCQTAPEVLVTSNVQIFLIKTVFIVFDLWHSSTGVAIINNSLTKITKMLPHEAHKSIIPYETFDTIIPNWFVSRLNAVCNTAALIDTVFTRFK